MFHSHCIRFLREEKYQPPDYELKPGAPAPDTVCIKDFIRWYIDLSAACGRVSKNKKPTVRSTCTFAERFFSGFKNATTSKIVQEDQSEIYSVCMFSFYILPLLMQLQWIKKALTANKVIKDVKKQQKFNFTRDDFQNTTSSLWTRDSLSFIHGLLKIFILFALQVYLFTGARIGAFVPEHKYRNQRGLRYKVRLLFSPARTRFKSSFTLFYYTKSLVSVDPFPPAGERIKLLLHRVLNEPKPNNQPTIAVFMTIHGKLFAQRPL